MNKKVYYEPQAKVVQIEANVILAGSGTGATGEDVPWARAKRRNRFFDDDFDEDEEYL